jgi:hypothetical protein
MYNAGATVTIPANQILSLPLDVNLPSLNVGLQANGVMNITQPGVYEISYSIAARAASTANVLVHVTSSNNVIDETYTSQQLTPDPTVFGMSTILSLNGNESLRLCLAFPNPNYSYDVNLLAPMGAVLTAKRLA